MGRSERWRRPTREELDAFDEQFAKEFDNPFYRSPTWAVRVLWVIIIAASIIGGMLMFRAR